MGWRPPFFLNLVNRTEKAPNLLETTQSTFADGPVTVLWIVGKLWQAEDHAERVESLFVAIGLQVIHYPLK